MLNSLTIHTSNLTECLPLCYRLEGRQRWDLGRTLSIKLCSWCTCLAAMSCSQLHILLLPLWWYGLTISEQTQMIHPTDWFLLQGKIRFVASSFCEGTQAFTGMMDSIHSEESSCPFPRLAPLQSPCSRQHQTLCARETKGYLYPASIPVNIRLLSFSWLFLFLRFFGKLMHASSC